MIAKSKEFLIDESQWDDFAERLVKSLLPGDAVLLSGEMGAGKTTLVFHLLQALKSPDLKNFSSPTFSIFQSYETSRFLIHHFDLYRLNTTEDWDALDLTDQVISSNSVSFVEWGDRFPLPGVHFNKAIRFQIPDDGKTRKLTCEGFDL